jgi:hypothetical protein
VNECLWCDAPTEGKLCQQCNTCPHCCTPITDHPLFHCQDPRHRHTVPTLGHSCAECDNIAEAKARRAAVNAPIIASLRAIRAQHVRDFHTTRWPGMEFGKAMFGIDGALKELES